MCIKLGFYRSYALMELLAISLSPKVQGKRLVMRGNVVAASLLLQRYRPYRDAERLKLHSHAERGNDME